MQIIKNNINQYFSVTNGTDYFAWNNDILSPTNLGTKLDTCSITNLISKYDMTLKFNYVANTRFGDFPGGNWSGNRFIFLINNIEKITVDFWNSSSSWTGEIKKGDILTFKYLKERTRHDGTYTEDACTISKITITKGLGGGGPYIGVNNLAKKVKQMYIGVNGVARRIKKAYIGINGIAKLIYNSSPLNASNIFTENGTFVVPETGTYTIELHGGGGGGGGGLRWRYTSDGNYTYQIGGVGGNSGSKYTNVRLTAGQTYAIIVGTGGAGGSSTSYSEWSGMSNTDGENGTKSSFGNLYTVEGGGGGGSATSYGSSYKDGAAGINYGTLQTGITIDGITYGTGGAEGSVNNYGGNGNNGIVIITKQ